MFLASLVPNILVVTPSVAAKTVADIIELAKKTPGGLDFASSGNGTLQHLCLELFRNSWPRRRSTTFPIAAAGSALNDVVAGQVKYFFSNGSSSVGLSRAARSRRSPTPARAGSAPCPTCRRCGHPPGLRGLRVERRVRAARHPAGEIVKKLNAAQRGAAPARRRRALQVAQHRRRRTRRTNSAPSSRRRPEMGQGGEGRRHQAGVSRLPGQ